MSQTPAPSEDRLLELLAEEAEHGLAAPQARELTALLQATGRDVPADDLALAAAAAYRVFEQEAGVIHEPMPAALCEKIIARGIQQITGNPAPRSDRAVAPPPIPTRPILTHPAWGWFAAAAVLVLAVTTWLGPRPPASAPGNADARAALLTDADDVVTCPWAGSDDPVYGRVRGDVVWSDRAQRGYLRLVGMPVNDPSIQQYQLWIVDPEVDRHPVDGGVFDVTTPGQVIVPIDAKLRVDKPTVFAITVERPGGVVVSAGPLRVVAAAAGGA